MSKVTQVECNGTVRIEPIDSEQCSEYADFHAELAKNTAKSDPSGSNGAQNETNPKGQIHNNVGNKGDGVSSGNKNGKKRIPLCWGCNASDHKYSICPRRGMTSTAAGNPPVCMNCKFIHPPNLPCQFQQFQPPGAVYSTAVATNVDMVGQGVFNPFIIPVRINGIETMGIRDTGNLSPSLVDPSLVSDSDYTGKSVFLKGAFDGPMVRREVPLAIVKLASDALDCCNDVHVEVGVCVMPPGLLCNIGNSLFCQHPQFTDIVDVGGGGRTKTFPLGMGPGHQSVAGGEAQPQAIGFSDH